MDVAGRTRAMTAWLSVRDRTRKVGKFEPRRSSVASGGEEVTTDHCGGGFGHAHHQAVMSNVPSEIAPPFFTLEEAQVTSAHPFD
jgi:hypothetical protein